MRNQESGDRRLEPRVRRVDQAARIRMRANTSAPPDSCSLIPDPCLLTPVSAPPRGIVLVVVLVVIVVLALSAYAFSELMITQREATEYAGRQAQARMLVDSGVDALRLFLMKDRPTQTELGGHFDNPMYFQAQLVLDDPEPGLRGRFTVLAPLLDEQGYAAGGLRYGLENESARVNVNALVWLEKQPTMEGAGRDLLMALPNMTEDIADAIMDYVDEDAEPREFGAEDEYYLSLDPPYAPKNAPLDSVEELLLVRGVTPQLLFGADANRNGLLDPHEMTEAAVAESPDGTMDRGWSAYLTLWSMERNVSELNEPRIDINQEDLQQLHDQLSAFFDPAWANFIVAYRQYGPHQGDSNESAVESAAAIQLDLSQPAKHRINQVIEMIGAKVRIASQGGDREGGGEGRGGGGPGGNGGGEGDDATIYESPFPDDLIAMGTYLPVLLDRVSVNPNPWIPGRININQAPRAILVGIPGLSEEIADEIIANRQMPDGQAEEDPNRRFETWLMTAGIVTLQEMQALTPFITAGGDVYRAQVVGYFEDGAASARSEVILDATQTTPRLLFWRDLSHLGRGYPLETLGAQLADER